jgi:hypothetical protein
MKPQILPKAAAGVCAVLLAGGAGLAVSQARSDSALPSGGTAQQEGMRAGPDGPGGGMMDLSGLADALGASESELQAALDSLRSSTQPGRGGGPDELAAALAKALDLPESDVAAALEANRPDRGSDGPPPDGSTAPPSATPSPDGSSTGPVSG